MKVQEVEVYVGISGNYCAFHEISLSVKYDITNDINFGYMTLEELQEWEYEANYSDYEIRDALRITYDNGKVKYFIGV